MKHFYLFISLLLTAFQIAFGQQNGKLVNVNYQAVSIDKMAADLQQQTNYHFYYDAAKLGDLKGTVQGSDLTLENVLNIAFKGTDYHYALVNQQVFITKGRTIEPVLLANLNNNANPNANAAANAPLDYTDDK